MRFSIHVDAGYLYAALATRETGSSNRAAVVVDEAMLVRSLVELAQQDSGMNPLRVLWYDAAHNAVPDAAQKKIGMIDGVKLRMGRVNPYGEQKGVDLRLGLDLVSYGVNRAVDIAYLISGDDDISEAVTDAQDLGVQVKLITVPTADGQRPLSVAQNLLLSADGVMSIPPEAIDRAVHRAGAPGPSALSVNGNGSPAIPHAPVVPPSRPPAPSDPAPVSGPAPSAPAKLPTTGPVPTPAARPTPAPAPRSPIYSTATGESPHKNSYVDPADVEEVARTVFEVWSTTATDEEKDELRGSKPIIPQRIDRILLTDLVTRTGVDDIPSDDRYLLRQEFWRAAGAGLRG